MKLKKKLNKFIKIKNKFNKNKLNIKKRKKKTTYQLLITTLCIPPIYYFLAIRNSEKINKENYFLLLLCFLWGMFPGVILTLLLYSLLDKLFLNRLLLNLSDNNRELINASIIAPIIEEFTKGLGLFLFVKSIDEQEDGIIYGAISGLGFATIENLLYSRLGETLEESIIITIFRQLTSTILHMFASSKFGEGLEKSNRLRKKTFVFYNYLESVFYHFLHNFTLSIIPNISIINASILILFIVLYNILFRSLKKNIKKIDILSLKTKKKKIFSNPEKS